MTLYNLNSTHTIIKKKEEEIKKCQFQVLI
jgi:hypothetical protein